MNAVVTDITQIAAARNIVTAEPQPCLRPVAHPIMELQLPTSEDPKELLKHRFLCEGGGLLFVGPTGVGKSSFSMQCMINWALGKECFGIIPARPLKSLLIQAENDDGDLAEMRDGVMNGLGLSEDERAQVNEMIYVYQEDGKSGDLFFRETVEPLLQDFEPDLLWIDPALAYLGGESSDQRVVGRFLRECLNPLIHRYECGAIVVHHTNKPPSGNEKPNWSTSDMVYLGNGSSEWSNWPRAALAIRKTASDSVFELHAAKRGKRLRWRMPDNTTRTTVKFIAHAMGDGEMCWYEANAQQLESLKPKEKEPKKTAKEVITFVPWDRCIEKNQLIKTCQAAGIGIQKARALIDETIEAGQLFPWKVPNSKGPAAIWIGRTRQPENYKPGDELGCSQGYRQAKEPVTNPCNQPVPVVDDDGSSLIGSRRYQQLPVSSTTLSEDDHGCDRVIPDCPIGDTLDDEQELAA